MRLLTVTTTKGDTVSYFKNYLSSTMSDRANREALVRRYVENLSSALLAEVSPVTPWSDVCENHDLYCMSEGYEMARMGFVDDMDEQCWDEARDIVKAAWENSYYQLIQEHEDLLREDVLEAVTMGQSGSTVMLVSRDSAQERRYLRISCDSPEAAQTLYRLVSQVIDEELGQDLTKVIPTQEWSYS